MINSIVLAMENYEKRVNFQYEETDVDKFVKLSGIIFTLIFAVELILKVIAMGFVLHKSSYLRDWWNRLDFLIVTFGLLEILNTD